MFASVGIITAPRTPILSLALVGMLALSLAGCSSPVSDGAAPDGTTSEETTSDESAPDGTSDDEVVVIGGDLVSLTVRLLAEKYAEGRDPQPTVEFLDATTVRFAFPDGVDELGNCQIAYGVMSGEGVRVLMTVGATDFDCTAEIDG